MFDYKLTSQNLPIWLSVLLQKTVLAPDFEALLGQTIGISDPYCAGGSRYALALAHSLLCEKPLQTKAGGLACGNCGQCALLKVGNHPDLMCLIPENLDLYYAPEKEKKPSKVIKIEQLRVLESNFMLSSQRGGRKVVIIYPAESLGVVPANALLKTLEEPPPNTFFIVVSEMWAQVLPTIRSRCICQVLSDPDLAAKIAWLEQAQVSYPKRWLELASGKIDTALAMAQDPLWLPLLKLVPELLQDEQIDSLGLAQQMSKAELKRVVYVLILLMHDLLAVSQAAPAKFFAVYTDTMRNKVSKLKVEAVNHYLQRLTAMARIVEHPLNARVQCEALLVDYKNCFFSISSIK